MAEPSPDKGGSGGLGLFFCDDQPGLVKDKERGHVFLARAVILPPRSLVIAYDVCSMRNDETGGIEDRGR